MIIIPDVHGRTFWKSAVEGHETEEIIFLGDYLDPYPQDFPSEERWEIQKRAISNFEEILKFKREHMDNVTLLLGNHDLGYYIGRTVCDCRSDANHRDHIKSLFKENGGLFKLCYEKQINGKRFIFSHSGIRKEWLALCQSKYEGLGEENMVDFFNNQFALTMELDFPSESTFAHLLCVFSLYRGMTGCENGSIIWSDVEEWLGKKPEFENTFFVFGHTYIRKELIRDNFACLDCAAAFTLNDKGEITKITNGK